MRFLQNLIKINISLSAGKSVLSRFQKKKIRKKISNFPGFDSLQLFESASEARIWEGAYIIIVILQKEEKHFKLRLFNFRKFPIISYLRLSNYRDS